MALVLPSFVRVLLSRREDPALPGPSGELVSARALRGRGQPPAPPRPRARRRVGSCSGRRGRHCGGPAPALASRATAREMWGERGRPVRPEGQRDGANDQRRQRTRSPSRSARPCPTSEPRSSTSSTSWPTWWGWPSSAASWPSRRPSRLRTTGSPDWPTAASSSSGSTRRSATWVAGEPRWPSCSSTSIASSWSTIGQTTRPGDRVLNEMADRSWP